MEPWRIDLPRPVKEVSERPAKRFARFRPAHFKRASFRWRKNRKLKFATGPSSAYDKQYHREKPRLSIEVIDWTSADQNYYNPISDPVRLPAKSCCPKTRMTLR